jgi:hypothetical protein
MVEEKLSPEDIVSLMRHSGPDNLFRYSVPDMPTLIIRKFSELLQMEIGELIVEYGCGSGYLTLRDAQILASESGNTLGLVVHAA